MRDNSLVSQALASELTGICKRSIHSHPYLLLWLILAYALSVSYSALLSEVGTISDLLFLLKSSLDRISQ